MTKLELDQAFKEKVRHLVFDKNRGVGSIARSTFRTEGYVRQVVEQVQREARVAPMALDAVEGV